MMGVSLGIVIFTLLSLRLFTRHSQSFVVPDFTGLSLDQLQSVREEYDFEFVIIDSVFDETNKPGTIIRHDPAPDATVKRGRKFYVTTAASLPDMVLMPNLIDLSLRQATALLQSKGLSVGRITYQPDFSQNAVIAQMYHGKNIIPNEKIRRGSHINLVVSGSRQSNQGEIEEETTDESKSEESLTDE
jgi:beta-lactam-binding protein with PASTA domain